MKQSIYETQKQQGRLEEAGAFPKVVLIDTVSFCNLNDEEAAIGISFDIDDCAIARLYPAGRLLFSEGDAPEGLHCGW
jgi:hypothetical protein